MFPRCGGLVALLVDIFGTGHGIGRLLLVGTFGYLVATVLARAEAHLLRTWQRSEP